jgi:hypothetical protein
MAILVRGNKEKPVWLDDARDLCRREGISVVGWGPNMLTVEAKSASRASEIANHLGQLGLKVVKNPDDEDAGLLDLSPDPNAVEQLLRQQTAAFDISRLRWSIQVEPLIFLLGSSLLIPKIATSDSRTPAWTAYCLGLICLVAFFWDAARIWGWRLELLPEGLRVRRYFRWATIPWDRIHSVESVSAGRNREVLVLKLITHKSERLGKFDAFYVQNARDRLRQELADRAKA